MELYNSSMAGSGQFGLCENCKKPPITSEVEGKEHEVYDGCIGELQGDIMNACCGHGSDEVAYIQYWNGNILRGKSAIEEQKRLATERDT
tara:strand:- start:1289 stop:1558 length:270 start_codon:yes stop_codon:yes gene_type:complete